MHERINDVSHSNNRDPLFHQARCTSRRCFTIRGCLRLHLPATGIPKRTCHSTSPAVGLTGAIQRTENRRALDASGRSVTRSHLRKPSDISRINSAEPGVIRAVEVLFCLVSRAPGSPKPIFRQRVDRWNNLEFNLIKEVKFRKIVKNVSYLKLHRYSKRFKKHVSPSLQSTCLSNQHQSISISNPANQFGPKASRVPKREISSHDPVVDTIRVNTIGTMGIIVVPQKPIAVSFEEREVGGRRRTHRNAYEENIRISLRRTDAPEPGVRDGEGFSHVRTEKWSLWNCFLKRWRCWGTLIIRLLSGGT